MLRVHVDSLYPLEWRSGEILPHSDLAVACPRQAQAIEIVKNTVKYETKRSDVLDSGPLCITVK